MSKNDDKDNMGGIFSSLQGPSPMSGYEDEKDPHMHLIILFIIVVIIGAVISLIAP